MLYVALGVWRKANNIIDVYKDACKAIQDDAHDVLELRCEVLEAKWAADEAIKSPLPLKLELYLVVTSDPDLVIAVGQIKGREDSGTREAAQDVFDARNRSVRDARIVDRRVDEARINADPRASTRLPRCEER